MKNLWKVVFETSNSKHKEDGFYETYYLLVNHVDKIKDYAKEKGWRIEELHLLGNNFEELKK